MGNGVTSIGNSIFEDCTSLTSINIATNNSAYTAVDGILYNKNRTTLVAYPAGKTDSTFTISNSVTSIGNGAFSSCINLTSITIPNNVTNIGEKAFYDCKRIRSITISNNLTSIGSLAFAGCINLGSIAIPNSVTRIEEYAFNTCLSLTSVTFYGTIASRNFKTVSHPNGLGTYIGDLREKFYETDKENGTPGTYTRLDRSSKTWTKQ